MCFGFPEFDCLSEQWPEDDEEAAARREAGGEADEACEVEKTCDVLELITQTSLPGQDHLPLSLTPAV